MPDSVVIDVTTELVTDSLATERVEVAEPVLVVTVETESTEVVNG